MRRVKDYDSKAKVDFDDVYGLARVLLVERSRNTRDASEKQQKRVEPIDPKSPIEFGSLFETVVDIDDILKELTAALEMELIKRGFITKRQLKYYSQQRRMDHARELMVEVIHRAEQNLVNSR